MQIRKLTLAATAVAGLILSATSSVHAAAWVPSAGSFGNFNYTGGQDSDGLFGSPTNFGPKSIEFDPLSFRSISTNNDADLVTDTAKVNLSTKDQSKGIFDVKVTEIGDYSIDNSGGVKAFAGLFVRVLDADWSFSQRVFTGNWISDPTFPVNGADAAGNWIGSVLVTLPAGARSISITLNNTLQTHSATGGSAFIQKKQVDISVNTPEPTTLAVIFGGLGFIAARRRKA